MVFKRILPLLCVLLLLTSCGAQSMTPSTFGEKISKAVVLSLAPGETDPSDGLAAVICNLSDREFGYSYAFSLETEKADGWYRLPLRRDFAGFAEPVLFIPAASQYEHLFPVDRAFGPLKPGNYRILLDGALHNNGAVEKQYLLLAFTVTEDGNLLP